MYNHGEGVVHDDQQAVYWYRKASEQGFAIAERNLGVMYVLGQGVEANETEAMRWFAKAVASGANPALINQALLYMQGSQTAHDYAAAQKLLLQAVSLGIEDAKPLLSRCEAAMANRTAETASAAPGHSRQ